MLWRSGTRCCPSPVPARRSCISYHGTGYLIWSRALGWCALTFAVTIVLAFVAPEAVAGASPGKTLLRIRVVRPDGTAPGVARSVLRSAAWVVDGLALLLPVGLWIMPFTPGHRRVGDYVARTYVVGRDAAGRAVTQPHRDRPAWPSPSKLLQR